MSGHSIGKFIFIFFKYIWSSEFLHKLFRVVIVAVGDLVYLFPPFVNTLIYLFPTIAQDNDPNSMIQYIDMNKVIQVLPYPIQSSLQVLLLLIIHCHYNQNISKVCFQAV